MNTLIELFKNNWDLVLIIIALIEVMLRVIPTYKNYSLVDFIRLFMSKIHQVLDKYIPNNKINE
jgi:hypothetical protein